jgi:signal transduction histidine kinase
MSFIEDLIDLRQLHHGEFHLQNAPFEMQSVLKVIYDVFSPQARGKEIAIKIEIGEKSLDLDNLEFDYTGEEPVLKLSDS